MNRIIVMAMALCALCFGAQAIDLTFSADQYLPTQNGIESNWAARIEIRVYDNLWAGAGVENGQRQYVIELYEYTIYNLSVRYDVRLGDKISTFVRLAYYLSQVQDKGLTTREAFSYLGADEIPSGLMTWYDRVDISLDPGFGAEIGMDYHIFKHLNFIAGYRFLNLEEHMLGYGVEAGQPRNYWRERKVDFSAFFFGLKYLF